MYKIDVFMLLLCYRIPLQTESSQGQVSQGSFPHFAPSRGIVFTPKTRHSTSGLMGQRGSLGVEGKRHSKNMDI